MLGINGPVHRRRTDLTFGILVGTKHIIAASDNDGHVEGMQIGIHNHLPGGLAGRVRIGRIQPVILRKSIARARLILPVYLVRRDMDESTDCPGFPGSL